MLDKLLGDTKYICGDTITQYDIQVAGFLTNTVHHEDTILKGIQEVYEEKASEKIQTYVDNFRDQMIDYLKTRNEEHPEVHF